jgi:hypothetical protein
MGDKAELRNQCQTLYQEDLGLSGNLSKSLHALVVACPACSLSSIRRKAPNLTDPGPCEMFTIHLIHLEFFKIEHQSIHLLRISFD